MTAEEWDGILNEMAEGFEIIATGDLITEPGDGGRMLNYIYWLLGMNGCYNYCTLDDEAELPEAAELFGGGWLFDEYGIEQIPEGTDLTIKYEVVNRER